MKRIGGSRDAEIDCDVHAAVGQGAAWHGSVVAAMLKSIATCMQRSDNVSGGGPMLQRQGPGFDSERAIVQLTTTSGPKARFGGFDILIFIEIVRFMLPNHAF